MEIARPSDLDLENLTHQQAANRELLDQLFASREETAEAISDLAEYKAAVRATVIENIKNGTICREGANAALESWGDEPYNPRYTVRVLLDVDVTLEADGEGQARERAYNTIYVASYDDEDTTVYVNEFSTDDVTEVGQRR